MKKVMKLELMLQIQIKILKGNDYDVTHKNIKFEVIPGELVDIIIKYDLSISIVWLIFHIYNLSFIRLLFVKKSISAKNLGLVR